MHRSLFANRPDVSYALYLSLLLKNPIERF